MQGQQLAQRQPAIIGRETRGIKLLHVGCVARGALPDQHQTVIGATQIVFKDRPVAARQSTINRQFQS
ncbi:hypothetical protein D3C76_1746300 [compost metagenome]